MCLEKQRPGNCPPTPPRSTSTVTIAKITPQAIFSELKAASSFWLARSSPSLMMPTTSCGEEAACTGRPTSRGAGFAAMWRTAICMGAAFSTGAALCGAGAAALPPTAICTCATCGVGAAARTILRPSPLHRSRAGGGGRNTAKAPKPRQFQL